MKQQTTHSHAHIPGNLSEFTKKRIGQDLIDYWFRLTCPDSMLFSKDCKDQERLRHIQLLSLFFPSFMLSTLLCAPSAFVKPIEWFPVGVMFSFGCLGMLLNRKGLSNACTLSYILAINLSVILLMIIEPHGIRNSNIPDFDFLVLPILMASFIFPRWTLPVITFVQICIVLLLFTLLPHNPLLTQEIRVNQDGLMFPELSDAIILFVCGMLFGLFVSWNVEQSLLRASRAEELARAQVFIHEQDVQIAEQNKRLEHGMHVLWEVLSRSANKDYSARAVLENNELTPLALGFNLMIERLNRLHHVEQDYNQLAQVLQQLLDGRDYQIRFDVPVGSYHTTGSVVDQLYHLLEQYHSMLQLLAQCRSLLERLQNSFYSQKIQAAHLTNTISGIHLLWQQETAHPSIDHSPSSAFLSPVTSEKVLPEDIDLPSQSLTLIQVQQIGLIQKAEVLCEELQANEKTSHQEITQLYQCLQGYLIGASHHISP